MSVVVAVGLVLLPVLVYVFALALAACRERAGLLGLPRARCVARAVRRTVTGDSSGASRAAE